MKVTGGLRFSIATVVAVAALVPASATAHKVHWSTSSTISAFYNSDLNKTGGAQGQISSPKPACIANRTVKVYRNGIYVGQATSNESGFWQVLYHPADGMISATVTRKNIGAAGHRHICQRYVAGPVDAIFISS